MEVRLHSTCLRLDGPLAGWVPDVFLCGSPAWCCVYLLTETAVVSIYLGGVVLTKQTLFVGMQLPHLLKRLDSLTY